MAFVPCPKVAEFRMQFLWANVQCENVFHAYCDAGWDEGRLNEVAGTFANWWKDIMRPDVSRDLSLQRVMTRELSTESGIGTEYATGLPAAGGYNQASTPNTVALAVKWGTGHAGRSYRGRTFHMGLPAQLVLGNNVDATFLTALRNHYDGLRTALDNAVLGIEFGVLSRVHNGAPRPQGILTPITGVSIDPIVDTQRRRSPARG